MGYFLTTSLAPPATRPPASPKTHVPVSRLQERGHRFYSAEIGRWLGRDPEEENGGINLYGFVSNDPLAKWDYLGLEEKKACCAPPADFKGYWDPATGAGSTLTCDQICKKANSELNDGRGGSVVCWGNIKCACPFDRNGVKVGECKEFDKLVLEHEEGHMSQAKCDDTCKQLYLASWVDPKKANENECTARKKTIADLDSLIKTEKNAKCKKAEEALRESIKRWVKKNCK